MNSRIRVFIYSFTKFVLLLYSSVQLAMLNTKIQPVLNTAAQLMLCTILLLLYTTATLYLQFNCCCIRYLELVVGIVAVRVQPPVVGNDPGGVNREVIVGDGVGDVRVAPGVRVRGLHLQDGGPDGDILVYVVSLEKDTDVKNGDYFTHERMSEGKGDVKLSAIPKTNL
jgi:hypothetical protein